MTEAWHFAFLDNFLNSKS